jgi:hypothetical protein
VSLQRLIALPCLLLAAVGAWYFPAFHLPLLLALLVAALICWRVPHGWLFLLPALVPLADTAPWSGRLFLQDIDFFLLVLLAGALWHGQFVPARHQPLPRFDRWMIMAFIACYLASLHLGLAPFPARDNPNTFASYYSHYNGLRVARGVLWAVIFLPPLAFLFRRTPEQARHALLGGMLVGLLGTAMTALWERGVWRDLLTADNIYDRLDGLLDFSTPYRVTGLFSGMHTGGESIDGYLVLAWPCALVAALLKDAPRSLRILAILTLPLALYTTIATFSRASYLALAVCLALFCVALLQGLVRRGGTTGAGLLLTGLGGFLGLSALGFQRGGTLALAGLMIGYGGPALARYFIQRDALAWRLALWLGAGLMAAALILRAQITSKWVPVGTAEAMPLAVGTALLAVALGNLTGVRARRIMRTPEFGLAALVCLAVASTIIPAVFGFRMEARFATVSQDMATRTAHWQDGLALRPEGLVPALLGAGVGSFPRLYLLGYPDKLDGVAMLRAEDDAQFLELVGGKDVKVTQRVNLPAHRRYRLSLDYRLAEPEARLRMRICRRQMIEPLDYNGACRTVDRRLHATGGQWQRLSAVFDLGDLGTGAGIPGRAPLLLELGNRREYDLMSRAPATLALDNLSLRDDAGEEYLENGDFSARMDHWFSLYDFNHLPWHIKNMFVHLHFEQGLLGLLATLGLLGLALARGLASAQRGDLFALGLTIAIVGFCTVGLVGTLFDEPRIMLLLLLMACALLANRRAAPRRAAAR